MSDRVYLDNPQVQSQLEIERNCTMIGLIAKLLNPVIKPVCKAKADSQLRLSQTPGLKRLVPAPSPQKTKPVRSCLYSEPGEDCTLW